MKGLIKRSNGIYYIRIYEGDCQQWRSTGERNRKNAIRVAKGLTHGEPPEKEAPQGNSRKAAKIDEVFISDTSVTLNQIIEQGREYAVLHGRDKSVESWKTARGCLLRVGRLAGASTVDELAQRLPELRQNPPDLKKGTFESYLGNAASLFSRDRLEFYASREIAVRNPFEEIRICRKVAFPFVLPTREQVRFLKAKMDATLRVDDLMVYRVLIMAMGAGLRALEITHVRWHAIGTDAIAVLDDPDAGWSPKTYNMRTVPVGAAIVADLLATRTVGEAESDYVIQSGRRDRVNGGARKDKILRRTATWLRAQGSPFRESDKPLHLLRKWFGSMVCAEHGMEAARVYLGHSSILTTQRSYVRLLEKPALSFWEKM